MNGIGDPPRNGLVKNCLDVEAHYRKQHDPWISACRKHMMECESCRQKYTSYYKAEDAFLAQGIAELSKAYNSFNQFACSCGNNGIPGGGGAFALNTIDQICLDYYTYRETYPEDANIMALLWLQKVFITCRFFESQRLCENNIPLGEKIQVGKMKTIEGLPFSEVTSLSYIMKNHDKESSVEGNISLSNDIINLVNKKEYYRALRLICESPKHGVLSTILSLSAILRTEQIYSIGFHALGHCVQRFVKQNTPNNIKD